LRFTPEFTGEALMAWTKPAILAFGGEWFDSFDYHGPAVYELGTCGRRLGSLQWHYVGETICERSRLSCYARSGSHLGKIIDDHLDKGWAIAYRAYAVRSKREAIALQNRLLARFEYDWNLMLN
jgi:hypothetical protein